MSNRLQEIIDRNAARESKLQDRANELKAELEQIQAQIKEAHTLKEDARHLLQIGTSPDSSTPRTSKRNLRNKKRSAKTRRTSTTKTTSSKVSSTSHTDDIIRKMGIVDAAIALAERHNEQVADAGQVLQWFDDINYETRSGLPSRNSVYVSLNRDSKGNGKRIERHDRGQFRFNY